MDTSTTNYAEPQAKSRLDTVASSAVLATMLASVLVGAFLVDPETALAYGPDRQASAEEVQR